MINYKFRFLKKIINFIIFINWKINLRLIIIKFINYILL